MTTPSSPAPGGPRRRAAVLVLAGLVVTGTLAYAMLRPASCISEVVQRSLSPNGLWSARVQKSRCDGESSTEVLIQPLAMPENDVAACRAVTMRGNSDVTLAWTRFKSIDIMHHSAPSDVVEIKDQCFELGIKAGR